MGTAMQDTIPSARTSGTSRFVLNRGSAAKSSVRTGRPVAQARPPIPRPSSTTNPAGMVVGASVE